MKYSYTDYSILLKQNAAANTEYHPYTAEYYNNNMWSNLTELDTQYKVILAASAGQSIAMCAYAGGIRPQELFTALREGHAGNVAFEEFTSLFYASASEAQREVLENAKLKPDIWLNHTRDNYLELQAEHSQDFEEELDNATKD